MAARPRTEGLVLGSGLIVLGLLWTLANLGRLDLLATVRTWWPLLLVLWGALELLNARTARRDRRPATAAGGSGPDGPGQTDLDGGARS